jgi:hypothetical protein
VSTFAGDGTTVIGREEWSNVLADAATPALFAVPQRDADSEQAFVPQSVSWNVQVDHTLRPGVTLRANFISSDTDNVFVVNPLTNAEGRRALVLSSTGQAVYHALEITGRAGSGTRVLNVSFTRSRAIGDLNTFSTLFGDIPTPIVRANQESRLPTDAPNRLVAWGELALPRRWTLAPVFEIRSGFPYSVRNELQDFVGVRNGDATRFPTFMGLDVEVAKEVRLSKKYGARLSARIFNMTNHFNPRDIRANTADPGFGEFLSSYRRYVAGGFDIIF